MVEKKEPQCDVVYCIQRVEVFAISGQMEGGIEEHVCVCVCQTSKRLTECYTRHECASVKGIGRRAVQPALML